MKKSVFSGIMLFNFVNSFSQRWNPFVNQGIISPAPLLPVEFNGTGTLLVK